MIRCFYHKAETVNILLNRLVWESGYTEVVNSPTRGDALVDVYLVRPESAFTTCSNVQGISNHCGVLMEVERGEHCREHQVESLVPAYHKTKVTGLRSFSGVNSYHRQVSVVACRKFGKASRK
jgi:hypothetical protein